MDEKDVISTEIYEFWGDFRQFPTRSITGMSVDGNNKIVAFNQQIDCNNIRYPLYVMHTCVKSSFNK